VELTTCSKVGYHANVKGWIFTTTSGGIFPRWKLLPALRWNISPIERVYFTTIPAYLVGFPHIYRWDLPSDSRWKFPHVVNGGFYYPTIWNYPPCLRCNFSICIWTEQVLALLVKYLHILEKIVSVK
jgi:hypothetical protein